ncbi:MAG TPA: AI-2E family transporter [Bryobacteraceae bacterium]
MARRSSNPSTFAPIAISAAVIVTLYLARSIFIPLAFALVLAFVLTPVVGRLEKMHVPRILAVCFTILVSMAAIGGVGWVLGHQLIDVVSELPRYRLNIRNRIEALHLPAKGSFGKAAASVKEIGKELTKIDPTIPDPNAARDQSKRKPSTAPAAPLPVQVIPPEENSVESLRRIIEPFLLPLAMTGLVIVLTVFMLIKREDLRNRLIHLVGLGQLNVMTEALDDATRRISRYLLLQFLVNAAFGALFGLGLYAIGLPYAALWGAVAATLRIVPYVGTLIAAFLPLLLSLALSDTWLPPVLVVVLYGTLEILTANFVEPWLYGVHTGISSLAILVSAIFWTILWGPAGLILSTPLTVCVVVLGRYVPELSFLHVLLGDEPVLAAEAHLYQRLLAMDQQEARDVVDTFLKEHTLAELYDSVLIPALAMAEQDRHKGALDPIREEFLFLSVNEIVAELSSYTPKENEISTQPQPAPGKVFCFAASDAADEITNSMLLQLLEQQGYTAFSFPAGGSAPITELAPDDVICVSALPPFAFANARNLCAQLRARFPKSKLIVGIWGFTGDVAQALQRFERSKPDALVTSLAQVIEQLMPHVPNAPEPEAIASQVFDAEVEHEQDQLV